MLRPLSILLFSLIVLIAQFSCKFGTDRKAETDVKEFEGVITYHETLTNSDGEFNADDTVQVFYSHGNYVSIHSNTSQKFHLVKDYYFEKGPMRLYLFNNSDTLHQIRLNSPIEKLESFKVRPISEQTLSRKCEIIELNTS